MGWQIPIVFIILAWMLVKVLWMLRDWFVIIFIWMVAIYLFVSFYKDKKF